MVQGPWGPWDPYIVICLTIFKTFVLLYCLLYCLLPRLGLLGPIELPINRLGGRYVNWCLVLCLNHPTRAYRLPHVIANKQINQTTVKPENKDGP